MTARLRSLFPEAIGFVPPTEVGPWIRAGRHRRASRRGARATASSAREAMAHGRPVVATAVGGLVDVVEDGVTGLARPSHAILPALRAALERLLADPSRRARLGAAARARVGEQLGWARWLRAHEDAYATCAPHAGRH